MVKRLTLEEIGRIAGVSRATVSRVVNDHPNISDEVRERVQRVIEETGYQPNLVARSLASRQSNILGLVIPSVVQSVFTDPYYPRLIQGISQACNENDYTLSFFLFNDQDEEQKTFSRILGNGLIDGLIITADNFRTIFVPRLQEQQMPFVMIGRPEDPTELSYVDADNELGGYAATKHLIEQGCERIATIATGYNTAGSDRMRGFHRAFREAELSVNDTLIVYGDFGQESGYKAMEQLLPLEPDGVFVQSDTMALGAMQAVGEAGLSIPDDIAIVGFDDLPPAAISIPPLTTIRQSIKDVGVVAVETLLKHLQDPDLPTQHVTLPVELIERATTRLVEA